MKVMVFVDGENVQAEAALSFCERLEDYGVDELICTVAGNITSALYNTLNIEGVRIYKNAVNSNSADGWIAMLVAKAIYTEAPDAIVIISNDRDFLPIVDFAVSHGKRTLFLVNLPNVRKQIAEKISSYISDQSLLTLASYGFSAFDQFFGKQRKTASAENDLCSIIGANGENIIIPYFKELSLSEFYQLMLKHGVNVTGIKAKKLAEKYGFFVENGRVKWPQENTGFIMARG